MPGTFSHLLLHIVFSTKNRRRLITTDVAERLYPYMCGIVQREKGVVYVIGGMEDHVHIYLRWRPDATISDLMRTVKARSSRWMTEVFPNVRGFAWQRGYCVSSVSRSQHEVIRRYVANQVQHHRRHDLKSELLRLLRAHGVEFEERYVVDDRD